MVTLDLPLRRARICWPMMPHFCPTSSGKIYTGHTESRERHRERERERERGRENKKSLNKNGVAFLLFMAFLRFVRISCQVVGEFIVKL